MKSDTTLFPLKVKRDSFREETKRFHSVRWTAWESFTNFLQWIRAFSHSVRVHVVDHYNVVSWTVEFRSSHGTYHCQSRQDQHKPNLFSSNSSCHRPPAWRKQSMQFPLNNLSNYQNNKDIKTFHNDQTLIQDPSCIKAFTVKARRIKSGCWREVAAERHSERAAPIWAFQTKRRGCEQKQVPSRCETVNVWRAARPVRSMVLSSRTSVLCLMAARRVQDHNNYCTQIIRSMLEMKCLRRSNCSEGGKKQVAEICTFSFLLWRNVFLPLA